QDFSSGSSDVMYLDRPELRDRLQEELTRAAPGAGAVAADIGERLRQLAEDHYRNRLLGRSEHETIRDPLGPSARPRRRRLPVERSSLSSPDWWVVARRSRRSEARACKACYSGSIPLAASERPRRGPGVMRARILGSRRR